MIMCRWDGVTRTISLYSKTSKQEVSRIEEAAKLSQQHKTELAFPETWEGLAIIKGWNAFSWAWLLFGSVLLYSRNGIFTHIWLDVSITACKVEAIHTNCLIFLHPSHSEEYGAIESNYQEDKTLLNSNRNGFPNYSGTIEETIMIQYLADGNEMALGSQHSFRSVIRRCNPPRNSSFLWAQMKYSPVTDCLSYLCLLHLSISALYTR